MNRFAAAWRRLEAIAAAINTRLATVSRPGWLAGLATLVTLGWWLTLVAIKAHLISTGILTGDLAYYQNMLFNTGYSSSAQTFEFLFTWKDLLNYGSVTFLTEHFSPTLALLAPGYWLVTSPIFLVLLQPTAIALAAWGLFRLAKGLIDTAANQPAIRWLPLLLLVTYLFNYANVSATVDTIYGFHHDCLVPLTMVWALVAAREKRWRAALVFLLLFLGLKENLPILAAIFFGLCLLRPTLIPRSRAWIGIALCALFFLGCYYFQLRTHNRHVGIVHGFLDPEQIGFAYDRLPYWEGLERLWPALFCPFFALPALAELVLQLFGRTTELDWHSYPVMMLAIVGVALSLAKVSLWIRRSAVASLLLVVAIVGLQTVPVAWEGIRACRDLSRAAHEVPVIVDVPSVVPLVKAVPRNVRLATSSDLLVFATNRRKLLWPEVAAHAEYILLNRRTKEENQARRERFLAGQPTGSGVVDHFYGDMGLAIGGYGYDEILYDQVARSMAAGEAEQLQRQGALELYRMKHPIALPENLAAMVKDPPAPE